MSHGWLSTAQYDTPPVCYVATVKLRSTPDIRRESQIPASYPSPPPYRDIVIRFPPVNTAAAPATPPYSSSIIQNFPTIITKYHSPRLTGWLAGWLADQLQPVGCHGQKASVDSATTGNANQRIYTPQASKQITHTHTHTHTHYHTVIIQSFIPQNFLYFIYFIFSSLRYLLLGDTHTHLNLITLAQQKDRSGAIFSFFLFFAFFFLLPFIKNCISVKSYSKLSFLLFETPVWF